MKMKTRVRCGLLILAFSIVAFGATSVASEHPNLGGTWKLNVTKSDFSRLTGLRSETLKIEHQEPKLKVRAAFVDNLGDRRESYDFTTDGKTNPNTMRGFPAESSSVWDGDELVFDVRRGPNFAYKERWSLSPDGNTLTIKRHTILSRGETNEVYVFDKR